MCFPAGVLIAPIVEGYLKVFEAKPPRTMNELKEGIQQEIMKIPLDMLRIFLWRPSLGNFKNVFKT